MGNISATEPSPLKSTPFAKRGFDLLRTPSEYNWWLRDGGWDVSNSQKTDYFGVRPSEYPCFVYSPAQDQGSMSPRFLYRSEIAELLFHLEVEEP